MRVLLGCDGQRDARVAQRLGASRAAGASVMTRVEVVEAGQDMQRRAPELLVVGQQAGCARAAHHPPLDPHHLVVLVEGRRPVRWPRWREARRRPAAAPAPPR